MNWLFGLPILLPLLGMTMMLAIPQNRTQLIFYVQLLMTLIFLAMTVVILFEVSSAGIVAIHTASWPSPFGISFVFDGLSALMLFIFALVGAVISLYSLSDEASIHYYKGLFIGYWLLFLGITGSLLTADLFNLYVWFEVILVGAFVVLSCSVKPFKQALLHYVVLNIVGTLIILMSVVMIYGVVGSLSYASIALYFQQHNDQYINYALLVFLLFGLSVKGAIFPLYFWLPKAYPVPSITSISLLSSLVTKTVMVILLRFVLIFIPMQSSFFTLLLVFIGIVTMVLGVLGAAAQFSFRKILSFHIISQLGYIVVAIAIHSTLAIVAAVYFVIHNIFVKTNLFLSNGYIEKVYGTDDLKHLGHAMKHHKWLALIFFLSAFSLAGFPPLSGFWGKFLLIKAAIVSSFYLTAIFAILVSLFTLYSMTKIWHFVFCQKACEDGQCTITLNSITRLEKLSAYSAMWLLTIMMLIIGIFPEGILHYLTEMAIYLQQPNIYIHAVLGGTV